MGCNGTDEVENGSAKVPYDPNQPVTLTDFMPDSGRLREKVIIKGSNFGNDKSKVAVYFNDGLVDRKSTVIGIDNNTIYCLAPRQEPGRNRIKVQVTYGEADETAEFPAERTFGYSQAENITTISGLTSNGGQVDGSLAEAKFSYIHGIGALGNEAMLIFQRDNASVRYVSVQEDKVITVHSGFQAAKPAVTQDKNTVFATGWNTPHVLYRYDRSAGWSPQRMGQLSSFAGRIRSVCFGPGPDGLLNEDYLYFIDGNEKFGRYNLKAKMGEETVEVIQATLRETTGNTLISVHSDGNYMIYNHYDGYFYFTEQEQKGVYRMKLAFDEAGKPSVAELTSYTGFKNDGIVDGYLNECSFIQPNGITLDDMGNIFIVEGWSVNVLRKISTADGYVSTICGKIPSGSENNNGTQVDGLPSEARLCSPYDIANDGEGNYWIAEGWGCAIRKYAIE
jgi:hypothetical protein